MGFKLLRKPRLHDATVMGVERHDKQAFREPDEEADEMHAAAWRKPREAFKNG